jgi:wyosine [tRNA(Phe)-imidazoG37] synthetase (radical SAM superfamily)
MSTPSPSTPLFAQHSRHWRDNRYVYPVVSRRSRGLSIGVNLNPDQACNFDCVYCSVDRTVAAAVTTVDLAVLGAELTDLCARAASGSIWTEPPFDQTPPALRRWNDVAFSGDGEPTAYAGFAAACQLASAVLVQRDDVKTVVITNATLLDRPATEEGLRILDQRPSEVWAKLDAGTEAWYQTVERSKVPLAKVVANLAAVGRRRPLVIQSLFLRVHDREAGEAEYDAWADRLAEILRLGARIDRVQVYTTARATAESFCAPLPVERLEAIADRARRHGLLVEVHG